MFTGIIEEMGQVVSMSKESGQTRWDGSVGDGYILVIACKVCLIDCYVGASIAVNGVCLTATKFDDSQVTFGVAPETIRLTNLVKLNPGSNVNMERAAKMGDRNSGHYVQGHVDGVATVLSKTFEGESLWVKLKVPKELAHLIVYKGFIAVDGTSLTVCEVNFVESWFTFMLVSHTQSHIIIPHKDIGDEVNIEIDVMGKFVAQATANLTSRVQALEEQLGSQSSDSRLDVIENMQKQLDELMSRIPK